MGSLARLRIPQTRPRKSSASSSLSPLAPSLFRSCYGDHGEGHTTIGEALQYCVPDPLWWLQQGLHRGDHPETGDKAQGTPRGTVEKSAVAEHAWDNQHSINWEETSIIDQARRHKELLLKEALHIHMTPADQRINRDEGLELPGYCTVTLKRLGGRGWQQPARAIRSRVSSRC